MNINYGTLGNVKITGVNAEHQFQEMTSVLRIVSFLGKDSPFIFIDVGAHIGTYSLLAKFFPNGHFFAFEPIQENYEQLVANIALNNLTNVVCVNKAVGAQNGFANIYYCPNHSGLHTMATVPLRFKGGESREVEVVSLDSYFADLPSNTKLFLKMDTEGYENEVLRGAGSLRFEAILTEYNKVNLKQCEEDPAELFRLLGGYTIEGQYDHENLLFIKGKK